MNRHKSEWKGTAVFIGFCALCAYVPHAYVPQLGDYIMAGLAIVGFAYLASKWKSGDL